MAKKLFEGLENKTPQDTRRIPIGYPGINGAEYIEWQDAKAELLADINAVTLNTDPVTVTDAGTVIWNKNEYTIDVITGLGATIQVGHETLVLVYNNTGSQTNNGKILHPIGAFESGSVGITYELADASKWEKCQGTLIVATHDIPNGSFGLATRFGKVRGVNTSTFTGAQLWLTDDGNGDFTETKPQFPSYPISMGGSIKIHSTDGEIFVSVLGTENDTFNDAWDGAIRESFDFLITSDGVTVLGTLSNSESPGDDLTLIYSSGLYTFDVSADGVIDLTAGTDSNPQTNYVYIPQSSKALSVSTTGWPSSEHCKIAQLEVQSATTVQSEGGAIRNQNINDHIKTGSDNGHILHIAERVRQLPCKWNNGTEATLTGTTTNGYIQVTSGQAWQMHKQTFSAFSMPTRSAVIVNDFTTSYRRTTNLNTINAYSTGSTWNNQWGKIVVWGIANKTGQPNYIMVNLPSNGYNSEANAVSDALGYANYTIPNKYNGVGFLIAAFTIRISSGTITYNSGVGYQDLRGFFPNTTAGGTGGGGGITTFLGLSDTPSTYSGSENFRVQTNNDGDALVFVENEIAGSGVTLGFIDDQAQSIAGEKTFTDNILVGGSYKTTQSATVLRSSTLGTSNQVNNIQETYSSGNIKIEMFDTAWRPMLVLQNDYGSNGNAFIGYYSGNSILATGSGNTGLGAYALTTVSSGDYNTAIGISALNDTSTGNYNTAIGISAGRNASTGNNGVFLGANAGRYETASNKLFIDSLDRTNESTARTSSLLYGEFNSTVANQLLRVNSKVQLPQLPAKTTETNYVYIDTSTGALSYGVIKTANTIASSSTPSPTGDSIENEYYITALAANATFAAPSGTPANGNNLLIRIQDNGTSRTLTWNAIYESVETLPTATTAGKKMYIGFIYNSTDSKWDCVSVKTES